MPFPYTFPFDFDVRDTMVLDLTEYEEVTIKQLNISKATSVKVLNLYEPEEITVEILKL